MECACSLDVMLAEGVVTTSQHERGIELLTRVVSILTRTILNLRERTGVDLLDHEENGHHQGQGHGHGPEPEPKRELETTTSSSGA
jgi:hypothetical protein